MKSYRVSVNGKTYEVVVEETSNCGIGQVAAAAVKTEAAPVAPVNPGVKAPVADGATVNAPLSGSILAIKVKPGESVKTGQVLLTLEALKMENEIVAPAAGVVKEICVQTGSMVNVGDVLAVLG